MKGPMDHEDEPVEIEITDVLDLHTIHPRDVKVVVEEYLLECSKKGYRAIRIIHGKGTGFQREAVRKILADSDLVESFEDGPDWGSTAILLKNHT
jgi:DNA-nicking Smr family endonuclease